MTPTSMPGEIYNFPQSTTRGEAGGALYTGARVKESNGYE
jgi:hypothetical protein